MVHAAAKTTQRSDYIFYGHPPGVLEALMGEEGQRILQTREEKEVEKISNS